MNLTENKDYLHYEPLTKEGILHGFFNSEFHWNKENNQTRSEDLKKRFGFNKILSVKQAHTVNILDLSKKDFSLNLDGNFDAIIAPRVINTKPNCGIFIKTADCAPIILIGKQKLALIHAGWQGLAEGIINKCAQLIESPEIALIGPCAGDCCYEVQEDVLKKLDNLAHIQIRDNKNYLSIMGTAENILCSIYHSGMEIINSKICTICNQEYLSYRRDKTEKRNISFIGISIPLSSGS